MTPEPGVYCIEPDCHRPATTERPTGVTRDGELIVDLVCWNHSAWYSTDRRLLAAWERRNPEPRPVVCRNWKTPPYRPRWWRRLVGGRK